MKIHELPNPDKETAFENCVADVNIPVGEVFTSPVLEGTNGVLHVTKVFLNGLEYKTDYKIEISGINSDETISVPMAQAYEYTITTKPRNFDIVSYTVKDSQGNTVTDLSTVKGQTVTVSAELKNYELNENKNYEFIAALKSKDSKLTDCDSFKGALGLGESETANVQLNVPSEGDYTLEIFVWSSLESGVPILDKIVF